MNLGCISAASWLGEYLLSVELAASNFGEAFQTLQTVNSHNSKTLPKFIKIARFCWQSVRVRWDLLAPAKFTWLDQVVLHLA